MISSQLGCEVPEVDEVLRPSDRDFYDTGLKLSSVVRTTRLAIVTATSLHGSIGNLSEDRLVRIRSRIADWILGARAQMPVKQ